MMKNGNGCLYFADDSSFEGLCLFGSFVAHFEKEYRELLWNEGDEKYYPKGVEDEDYCILEFIAESGRFYRYDGKGDLSRADIAAYDEGRAFENGYRAMQSRGHTLAEVAALIRENSGVDIPPKALAVYLSRD